MASFITYQCSICRRSKDIATDNKRALIDQCNITKGCLGILHQIGETSTPAATAPVVGLTDWYQRGKKQAPAGDADVAPPPVDVNTGDKVLTLAVLLPSNTVINPGATVELSLDKHLARTTQFSRYTFNVVNTDAIFGRDVSNKTLKFTQDDIDNGLVQVSVYGVPQDPDAVSLVPNIVTLPSPVTGLVDVTVFKTPQTSPADLTFTYNTISTPGAWGNVRWISATNPRWFLFTCSGYNLGNNAILSVVSATFSGTPSVIPLADTRLLLANKPHEHVDRNLVAYVRPAGLQESNLYTDAAGDLIVDEMDVTPTYPILRLAQSSFIATDGASTEVSSAEPPVLNNYILGPV